jgi:hypothetical protein
MFCDLSVAQIILDFSFGGIGLRAIIALLKKLFKVQGPLASALSIGCCFIATAIYLAVTGNFSVVCFIIIGLSVYAGSQITYSLTKKRGQNETKKA